MFFILKNLLKHFLETLATQKPQNFITFCMANRHFAWYFMVFLVRTSFPAADTLTPGCGPPRVSTERFFEQISRTTNFHFEKFSFFRKNRKFSKSRFFDFQRNFDENRKIMFSKNFEIFSKISFFKLHHLGAPPAPAGLVLVVFFE